MQGIFNPDNKFNTFMSRVADLIILNVLFIVTSLPLITIGASWTALYTVCFRFGTEREGSTVHGYFEAFKANFKQSTILWLIVAAVMAVSTLSFLMFESITGVMRYLRFVPAAVCAMSFLVYCCVFPLLSQFDNRTSATLQNAMILSVGYLPRMLLIAILHLIPVAMFLIYTYWFLRLGFVFILLQFSLTAYLASRILRKVFDRIVENSAQEEAE